MSEQFTDDLKAEWERLFRLMGDTSEGSVIRGALKQSMLGGAESTQTFVDSFTAKLNDEDKKKATGMLGMIISDQRLRQEQRKK